MRVIPIEATDDPRVAGFRDVPDPVRIRDQGLVEAGRLTGMRSIVRRDTGESDQAFLAGLATASGVETPTREGLARLDRKRKKKTSNTDWTNPHDPDAKVTKMKDGRTHLAHKAEHAVDMETGAIVAVTLQGADVGDTTTIIETAIAATEQVEDAQTNVDDRQSLEEIVGDKGYHSNQTLIDLDAVGIRSYFVAEGRFVVRRILADSSYHLQALLVTETAFRALEDMLLAVADPPSVYVASRALLREIGGFDFHQGCIGLVDPPSVCVATSDSIKGASDSRGRSQCDSEDQIAVPRRGARADWKSRQRRWHLSKRRRVWCSGRPVEPWV